MDERDYLRRVVKTITLIVLIVLICRITKGTASLGVALLGGCFALQGRSDRFLICYLLLPLMIMLNPLLLGAGGNFYVLTKIGNFFLNMVAIFRALTGVRRGRNVFPIGLLFVYLGVACLSSATGWFPLISYLKLLNYVFFIGGLYCVINDMRGSERMCYRCRVIFMAFACLVILGSLMLLPFPAMAYYTNIKRSIAQGVDLADANALVAERTGVKLFTGIVNQSQALGPITVGITGWVLCDMLFAMRKVSVLHMVLLFAAPMIIYMTRSRTAMISFLMILFILVFYALGKVRMSMRLKSVIRRFFFMFLAVLALGAVVSEFRSQAITKLLRKTEDVGGDQRGLMEAMTSSRMGKIEIMMSDFYRNPLLGMGFQVTEDLPWRYQMGSASLLSASVEKGNMFLTVLSETGIIGSIVFLCFLIRFYSICVTRRFMALLTLFTYFLAANLGEAVFFSPSGLGGILWMIVAVGGAAIDFSSKRRTEMEMMGFRG